MRKIIAAFAILAASCATAESLEAGAYAGSPLGRANQIGVCSLEKCKGPCGL